MTKKGKKKLDLSAMVDAQLEVYDIEPTTPSRPCTRTRPSGGGGGQTA